MDINGNLTTATFLSSLANTSSINQVRSNIETPIRESDEYFDSPAQQTIPFSDIAGRIRNPSNSSALIDSVDTGYQALSEGIREIRDLAIAAMNEELGQEERRTLNEDAQKIKDFMGIKASGTQFNDVSLLDQSTDAIAFHVSADSSGNIQLGLLDMESLFVQTKFNELDLTTEESAKASLEIIDNLQSEITKSASRIDESADRLASYIDTITVTQEDQLEKRSPVTDPTVARELAAIIKDQLKRDSSVFLQVQSNASDRLVLGLLMRSG